MISTATSRFFPENGSRVACFREAGDLTLDLLHRDGRVDDKWLGLEPPEFECLWALANDRSEIAAQAFALPFPRDRAHDADATCDPLDLDRLCAKLEPLGLRSLIDQLKARDPAIRPWRRTASFARR
jgi:hypothetical protein